MISLCGIQSSILDRRAHGEVISLVVTNPRITEWLYAGNLSPDSSQMPSAELTVCKSVTCEMLPLDKGHFITGYWLYAGKQINWDLVESGKRKVES